MENWRKFQALVAIGFSSQFAVIELSSSDERALDVIIDDIAESDWADWVDSVGINTEVPGLYIVTSMVNLDSEDSPEYADTSQAVVRYTLPSEAV